MEQDADDDRIVVGGAIRCSHVDSLLRRGLELDVIIKNLRLIGVVVPNKTSGGLLIHALGRHRVVQFSGL